MLIAGFLIIIPTLVIMVVVIPSYEHIAVIICLELFSIIMVGIALYSFYALSTSNPGIIPRAEKRPSEQVEYYIRLKDNDDMSDVRTQDIKLKICDTCLIVRPPRSFHCAKCDACIEVHDHHCPWVGGCVGMRNHKKFITFLFLTAIAGICGSILCLPPIIQKYELAYASGDDSADANFAISIVMGVL
jgi:palmitoyltransferase ZDHHC9/14/18